MSEAESIVLTGGRVIDPASGQDAFLDILIEGERIRAMGPDLHNQYPQASVRDVRGSIVTPGLIDIHTHVMVGFGDFCLPPDAVGVDAGVPTVVDAGTSGAATFGALRRAIIDHPDTRTRVLAFIDPCQIYLANKGFICHKLEIANDERNLDPALTARVLEAHDAVIVGFKVRPTYTDDPRVSPFLEAAKSLAGDRPIMIHLGGFPHTPVIRTTDVLAALRPGDIVTHAYRAGSGTLDETGEPTAPIREAVDRGVRLDVGHSSGDFHFPTARRLIERGLVPTTTSTDLNVFNHSGPVESLAETMSKIWALGPSLHDVLRMNTVEAAAAMGRADTLGRLEPERIADISVLRIEEGPTLFTDGQTSYRGERRLVAEGCFRAGHWYPAQPHPREEAA